MIQLTNNEADFLASANKRPGDRTPEDHHRVAEAKRLGMTTVNNAAFAAAEDEKING